MKKLCIKVTYHIVNVLSSILWLATEVAMWLDRETYKFAEFVWNVSGSIDEKRDFLYWQFNSKEKFNG